jgi:amidase
MSPVLKKGSRHHKRILRKRLRLLALLIAGSLLLSLPFLLFNCSDRRAQQQPVSPVFPRQEPQYNSRQELDFTPFEQAIAALTPQQYAAMETLLTGKTILEIQDLLHREKLTSEKLVLWYLSRIQKYDVNRLNAVLELNPAVLDIARDLDRERKFGRSNGYMFGIPVLLQDTIATGDGLHSTAGSFALKDWQPGRDAFLVSQLREAGAIILGKTNLAEWSNYMDPAMPNGFSTLGGQIRNPYGAFDVPISSSGSAVAAAADFATVTVGIETSGELFQPRHGIGIVALKTSQGMVSRDNIIPLLDWVDTPVAMAKTVTDAAVLLTTLIGVDKNDPATLDAGPLAGTDFTGYLNPAASRNFTIGLVSRNPAGQRAAEIFTDLGMEVVKIDRKELPFGADMAALREFGFRDSLNHFLAAPERNLPVSSLAAVVAVNKQDTVNRAPYGQHFLLQSLDTAITGREYLRRKKLIQIAYRQGLHRIFTKHDVDILIIQSREYAVAGFPAITVPAGYDDQPVAFTLTADYLGEAKLIAAAYAYEQQTRARKNPDLAASGKIIKESKAQQVF